MINDTAVDGDAICTVRLSIKPGDDYGSINVKNNVFLSRILT